MKKLLRYTHLWVKLTVNSFLINLTNRFNALLFFIGKLLRFLLFMVFLLALFSKTQLLASYNLTQTLFFYLTFNFLDTVTQLFFREVYRFRPMVVSGQFDIVLAKPMSPLFRALIGGADPLDLLMLIPYMGSIIYVGSRLNAVTAESILLYILLLVNGFLIATGFHILVLALAIMTTEIDHAVMIYRDLTSMGRVPIDIYREPLRTVVTFVVPIGVMMTFPVKALLGLLSPLLIIISFGFGLLFVTGSVLVWRLSLRQYASASS